MYTLWSTKTGQAVAGFDSEAEALAMIESEVAKFGSDYVNDLALDFEDDGAGSSTIIGEGAGLLALTAKLEQKK